MWDITVFLECGQFLRNKRSLNGAIERGDKLKLHALKFTSRYATSTTYLGKNNVGRRRVTDGGKWKNAIVSFDLPYWKNLLIQHTLEVTI